MTFKKMPDTDGTNCCPGRQGGCDREGRQHLFCLWEGNHAALLAPAPHCVGNRDSAALPQQKELYWVLSCDSSRENPGFISVAIGITKGVTLGAVAPLLGLCAHSFNDCLTLPPPANISVRCQRHMTRRPFNKCMITESMAGPGSSQHFLRK